MLIPKQNLTSAYYKTNQLECLIIFVITTIQNITCFYKYHFYFTYNDEIPRKHSRKKTRAHISMQISPLDVSKDTTTPSKQNKLLVQN